jgi:hypothetical protein
MPSKSKAQHNFLAAVAHNPAFAKKAGVPQSVGKDFNEADKGRKASFCARMTGVVKNAKGPAERAKASLKRWKC